MARPIDADELKIRMRAFATAVRGTFLSIEAILDRIDTQPTIDAVEVVHGRWIEHSHLEVGGECSVCGWQFQWFENDEAHYCPHCGAKMDGGV